MRQIQEDPSDLRRARKFLRVYLDGAVSTTQKYIQNKARIEDPDLTEKYKSLLSELEENFSNQREKLLYEDQSELDIEMEVLTERLALEKE